MSKKSMIDRGDQKLEFSQRKSKEDFLEGKKARKYKGVKRSASGRFGAKISDSIAKKSRWLGTFDTAEEAAAAYLNAATEMRERRSQINSKSCISASRPPDTHINKAPCCNRPELDSNTEPIDCKTDSDSGFMEEIISTNDTFSLDSDNNMDNSNIQNCDDEDMGWAYSKWLIETIHRGLYFKPEELE